MLLHLLPSACLHSRQYWCLKTALLIFFGVLLLALGLPAQAQVAYLDATGAAQTSPSPTTTLTDCSTDTLGVAGTTTWYAVSGNITCPSGTSITFNGTVNLIL